MWGSVGCEGGRDLTAWGRKLPTLFGKVLVYGGLGAGRDIRHTSSIPQVSEERAEHYRGIHWRVCYITAEAKAGWQCLPLSVNTLLA